MQKYICKYSRYYSYLFLSAYLFLIALTIFHYHNVDLKEGNYQIECAGNTASGPLDKLIDLHHECLITQFSSTLLNINYAPKLFSRKYDNKVYFILDRQNRLPHHFLSKHNLLRAPPVRLLS